MKPAPLTRCFAAFLVATALATVWGSVFQTQHNLSRLAAIGAEVPVDLRMRTTLLDLAGFAPMYAVLVAITLLVVVLVAGLLARMAPQVRYTLHALGGFAGLAAAIRMADALAPMPTLIAATRTSAGLLGMALGALVAGWTYAWMTRPRPGP